MIKLKPKRVSCLLFVISFLHLAGSVSGFTQNLTQVQVRNLVQKKRSIYYSEGVFFHKSGTMDLMLTNIRRRFSRPGGFERLVFDFQGPSIPTTYAYVDEKQGKLYFDFLDTRLSSKIPRFGTSPFISEMKFFPLDRELLTVEVNLKRKGQLEVFYLHEPSRLVVDIR